jgi:hypothetical protein
MVTRGLIIIIPNPQLVRDWGSIPCIRVVEMGKYFYVLCSYAFYFRLIYFGNAYTHKCSCNAGFHLSVSKYKTTKLSSRTHQREWNTRPILLLSGSFRPRHGQCFKWIKARTIQRYALVEWVRMCQWHRIGTDASGVVAPIQFDSS